MGNKGRSCSQTTRRKLQMQLQVLLPNRMSWILKKKLLTIMCSIPITTMLLIQTYWLCAFNADWNGCAYNCLRTCPAEQKVCVFDHDKYIKEVDAKKVQYEADLDKKV